MSKGDLNFKKKRILLTRPIEDSLEISSKINKEFDIFLAPLLEVKGIDNDLDNLSDIDIIIFTSKNGIRHFGLKELIGKKLVFTVGEGTKELANKQGINNVINVDGDLNKMQSIMEPYLKEQMKILHPTFQVKNSEIELFFSKKKCQYFSFPCYQSIKTNKNNLIFSDFMKNYNDGIVTLFSSRTAESFKSELKKLNYQHYCKNKILIALSKNIVEQISDLNFKKIEITDKPNLESAIKSLKKLGSRREI